MKLGKFEIYPVTDGSFCLDGGAVFGMKIHITANVMRMLRHTAFIVK